MTRMLEESKCGFQTGRNYAKVHHISIVFRFGTSPPKKIGGLKFGPKIRSCFFFVQMDRSSPDLILANSYQLVERQDSGGSKEMANCQFPGATFRPPVAPDLGKLRESLVNIWIILKTNQELIGQHGLSGNFLFPKVNHQFSQFS